MLSALFSTLSSKLGEHVVSKPFLIGSFLPVTMFVAACAGTAMALGGTLEAVARSVNPADGSNAEKMWSLAAWSFAVVTLALVWSGMLVFLFGVLEGRHLGPFRRFFFAAETARLEALESAIPRNAFRLRQLDAVDASGNSLRERLKARLRAARAAGMGAENASYPRAEWRLFFRRDLAPVARVIRLHRTGHLIEPAELEKAVQVLEAELAKGTADLLRTHHAYFVRIIDGARARMLKETLRLNKLRQFQFPALRNVTSGASAVGEISATRMGNLTGTIRSYGLDRYGIDLDVFWSRLQRAAKPDDGLTLQNAKTQVDLLVSLFWLTCAYAVIWIPVSLWVTPAPRTFVLIATACPVVARLLYLAAVENYAVFADLVRSEVDLRRFELLDAMHVARPLGERDEGELWLRLGAWIGFGDEPDVPYKVKDA